MGQPAGEAYRIGMRSRALWDKVAAESGVWFKACGSIHLAHRRDEIVVLEEFAQRAKELGYPCELLSREGVIARTKGAKVEGLLGGLYSPTEACVNPRKASADIARWLEGKFGVRFEFSTTVVACEDKRMRTADGRGFEFDAAVVCSGADVESLFPSYLKGLGMRLCKLQMLRTVGQPEGWELGTHLASGLTLRHYKNFAVCPGLKGLSDRVARETPELDVYGIHVMASQNDAGEVILGDSHEYEEDIEIFDKEVIDELILREVRKIIELPHWEIASRWHGVYAKHPTKPFVTGTPLERVRVFTGLGGAGMTMSFGAAAELWDVWMKEGFTGG